MPGRRAVNVGNRILVAKTCATCHQLKDAEHFRRVKNARRDHWQSECRKCQHITANRSDKHTNEELRAQAGNAGNPWTERDLEWLAYWVDMGLSRKEIAVIMGRSLNSITVAKNRYGIYKEEV